MRCRFEIPEGVRDLTVPHVRGECEEVPSNVVSAFGARLKSPNREAVTNVVDPRTTTAWMYEPDRLEKTSENLSY
jgi:hypothetical protein